MNSTTITLESLNKTMILGELLGKLVAPNDIICLDGDLGAGKTTFTQAIAKGLEVPAKEYVTSPTFAMLHQYSGRMPLFHMDFYRLNNSVDVINAGLDEYFYDDGLTVIEWGTIAVDIIPGYSLFMSFHVTDDTSRICICKYLEPVWKERLDKFISLQQ